VDAHDGIPLFAGHVEDHAVAEDAGDVDEDIELAPLVERLADEVFGLVHVRDIVVVGEGDAAPGLDFVDDLLGGGVVFAFAVNGDAEVVDDDARAFAGESEGDFAADAAAGARDDCSLAFEFSRDSWETPLYRN